ncbi:MAG TPA: ATP-binding protein [Gaiellaceae bacterium]|nr:ATP-binding protein [Gaiellaceae bacterium]
MTPRPGRRMSIRQHVVLLAVVLTLPLLAALAYAVRAERDDTTAAADATVVQLARLGSAGVGQFVDQTRLLMTAATRDTIAVAGAGPCSLELRELRVLRPEFRSVLVVSRGGVPTCSSPRTRSPLRSVASRPWFRQARRASGFTVHSRALDPVGGRLATLFVLPWRERGAVRGYLVLAVDLVRYQAPFTHLGLPNGALLGILDRRGVVQARSVGAGAAIGKRYDPIPRAGAETVTARGGDGILRVYAAAQVDSTGWSAYAGLPTATAYAASDNLLRTVVVTAVACLLLAVTAAFIVSQRFTRPIRRFGAAAARLAAGDTSARVEVVGPAELAASAAEFNTMIEHSGEVEEARRTALQRLAQADKLEAVGRLAGGVAHDFNNLLLAIRGYTELALEQRAREGGDDGNLREVLEVSDRAARLVQQLLVFGRRQPGRRVPVDLGEVVDEMEKMLRHLIGGHVELASSHPGEPVVTLADRGQLEQIVVNLALNARDAMPDGGRLTIDVSLVQHELGDGTGAGRYALLEVADTGCGIDPDVAMHIFEPFFSTKGEAGTGLGLATVHAIVAQSGGEVLVASEPGSGTTFRVYLPAQAAAALAAAPGPAAAAETPRTGTILLVDDDPGVRDVVGTMLESGGFDVLAADGAESAAALARGHRGELAMLVTDLVMPGLSGPATAERIRATHPGLPVLYMSGHADDPAYGGPGADERACFIQKPFSTAELLDRVDRLLARAAGEPGADASAG